MTVNLTGLPVMATAGADTTKWLAARGLTAIAALVPLRLAVLVSVAVRCLVAGGAQARAEEADAGRQGGVGRQAGLGIAAANGMVPA